MRCRRKFPGIVFKHKGRTVYIIHHQVKVAIIIQVGIGSAIRKRRRGITPGIGIVIKF